MTVSTHPVGAVRAPAARTGSAVDFDALYAATAARLTMQMYAYLGDPEPARATVDDAFARALGAWKSIRRHDDPIAWITDMAWTLASKRRPRATRSSDPLVRALATLPPPERRAVIMQVMAQMSTIDIAAREGITAAAADDRLRRGKAALSTALRTTKGN
jgi:RNA polymerase sigma-70 factor (ECF subfamily)